MNIEALFDRRTSTLTYVLWDPDTRDAAVIDPVLDYDPLAIATFTESADRVSAIVEEHGLTLHWVLETHAHADHLSGSQVLKARHGAQVGAGAAIVGVQQVFQGLFALEGLATDGSQFDGLFADGDVVEAGSLSLQAIATPGHTPACITWQCGDALFTGDALFMPDFGTGRCDFPKGSASDLFDSIHRLYALPDETRVFLGHDYQPGGRELRFETTIGASKAHNKQLRADTDRAQFVEWRSARDATLRPPRLLFQSIQVNANAGHLPPAESNGRRYLKLPMGVFPVCDEA